MIFCDLCIFPLHLDVARLLSQRRKRAVARSVCACFRCKRRTLKPIETQFKVRLEAPTPKGGKRKREAEKEKEQQETREEQA